MNKQKNIPLKFIKFAYLLYKNKKVKTKPLVTVMDDREVERVNVILKEIGINGI